MVRPCKSLYGHRAALVGITVQDLDKLGGKRIKRVYRLSSPKLLKLWRQIRVLHPAKGHELLQLAVYALVIVLGHKADAKASLTSASSRPAPAAIAS